MVSLNIWAYALLSVIIVSIASLIGVLALSIKKEILKKILIYFVSFSAGALFGDVFIHLLPEVSEEVGFGFRISLYVLSGIVAFFVMEKIIRWRHCHTPFEKGHAHSLANMNLFGDLVHNLIDGLIIGASYLASIPVGIATTLAVLLHEIPQEIGDFGVLLHGGYTRGKALMLNFIVSISAILGVIISLFAGNLFENITGFFIPFAAGGFIYIAGSDLIPELHKEAKLEKSLLQLFSFLFGIGVMALLLLMG